MAKINVVDSILGSGKTTFAINLINSKPFSKFIYITPYLDEVKRVKSSARKNKPITEPSFSKNCQTKLIDLHRLLIGHENICSTHALFMKANEKTREILKATRHTLILDEVMNVVQAIDMCQDDIQMLLNEDYISIVDNFVIWNPEKKSYKGKFEDIRSMSLNKSLICVDGKMMVWNFPVDIFDCFEEVYILTYKFSGQIQKYYYDFHGCEYQYWQVDEDYKLVEYTKERDIEHRKKLKDLVNIYDGKMNAIGNDGFALSYTWYLKDEDGEYQEILKNNLYNWFRHLNNNNSNKLWTTFLIAKNNLSGKGYTKAFLSHNTRATNAYKHTEVLAYCCNRFVQPMIKKFFSYRELLINENEYALSEMLQWIWRSAIRDGKSINIYIPSSRMRKLLENFLAECD